MSEEIELAKKIAEMQERVNEKNSIWRIQSLYKEGKACVCKCDKCGGEREFNSWLNLVKFPIACQSCKDTKKKAEGTLEELGLTRFQIYEYNHEVILPKDMFNRFTPNMGFKIEDGFLFYNHYTPISLGLLGLILVGAVELRSISPYNLISDLIRDTKVDYAKLSLISHTYKNIHQYCDYPLMSKTSKWRKENKWLFNCDTLKGAVDIKESRYGCV